MEGTMKKLVFIDAGQVEVDEVPIPECNADGVLVKIARAGICGSDVHAYTKGGIYGGVIPQMCGGRAPFGHEFVGTVVEAGENVTDFAVGDRVWVDPLICVHDPRFTCMAGGFAEYVATLSATAGKGIFLLPDNVPFSTAVLIEPFGVGVHTKNRAGVTVEDKVLQFGAGPIGLMAWAAMKHQGVKDVLVAERMATRIEFAKKFGANVIDNTDVDTYELAAETFGTATINSYERTDATVVLDCVGLGALIGEYLEKGRCNSRFCTLGLDQTPLTIKPGEFMSKQFQVIGARGYTDEDIAEVIEVLQDESIDCASLITGEFALEEHEAAFAAACDRNNGMKVVFNIAD